MDHFAVEVGPTRITHIESGVVIYQNGGTSVVTDEATQLKICDGLEKVNHDLMSMAKAEFKARTSIDLDADLSSQSSAIKAYLDGGTEPHPVNEVPTPAPNIAAVVTPDTTPIVNLDSTTATVSAPADIPIAEEVPEPAAA